MKLIQATLLALAVATTAAFAEDKPAGGPPPGGPGPKGPKHPPEEVFKKLDSNTDGALSLDEFKAGPMGKKDPAKAEEIFKKKDKDGNGSLSLDEFKAGGGPRPPKGDKPDKGPKPEDKK